ncbi:hypothetical protein JCM3263A_03870 [Thermobifida fusca]|uniref:DUF3105 domain-containing protein n=2 Tax=Thermobifida fusca TaxID=2021 RepID=A0A9P2TD64_THEFU|nr:MULTISPECIES: DUF3105 domain-containing protein [Thermobifida]AAZ54678.1 putative membrane protein [Thermobifida fusca YX]EOR72190.1 hypothetical protein TM51_03552 [Thermobifida fusca TM51]MBO2529463.1 DUF3105 domain-containing protein [Thermobifida sp.]MDD6790686.1 DUF3105 domain-containing protein [Thermobifida fusca]PPS96424.1 hypothetical protein BH05_00205 [Thermobifida fusca]
MGKSSAERRRQVALEMRARREREARNRKITKIAAIIATVSLVAGGIGYLFYLDYRDRNIEGLKEYTGLTRKHVTEDVDYEQSPPVGGDHHAAWQNCGVYDAPLRDLHAVHSLEHGAVWITYRPDLPEDEVKKLAEFYTPGSYVLVSPYEGDMPAPIVASAWGLQLGVESADDPRLPRFLRAYERGPQTPEPGAACHGAVGLTTADSDEEWEALLGEVQTMEQSEDQ